MKWARVDSGAVSIEPLEVSRWHGGAAMSYGFSMIVVGVNGWWGAEDEVEKAVEDGQWGQEVVGIGRDLSGREEHFPDEQTV